MTPEDREFIAKLLESLEWSATTLGPPHAMGWSDGARHRSCPACRGVHPQGARSSFIETAIGHKKACKLLRAMDVIAGGGK